MRYFDEVRPRVNTFGIYSNPMFRHRVQVDVIEEHNMVKPNLYPPVFSEHNT